MELYAKVLTVSSGVASGTRNDTSGEAVAELLREHGFTVVERAVVRDGLDPVTEALRRLATDFQGLVVTTGGSGFTPDDLTPEATASVIDREAPGLAEAMRAVNPLGRLSRGLAGVTGATIIVNLPGSSKGAREQLGAIIDVLPHALELAGGGRPH